MLAQLYAGVLDFARGYLAIPQLAHIADYIVPAGLGDDAGVLGCFALAQQALSA